MVFVCVVAVVVSSLVSEVACNKAQNPNGTSELSTNYGPAERQYGHMYKHPNSCSRGSGRTKGRRMASGRVRQGCRPNVLLDRYAVRVEEGLEENLHEPNSGSCSRERTCLVECSWHSVHDWSRNRESLNKAVQGDRLVCGG